MYTSALMGYSAVLDDRALAVVKASPDVVFVEHDQYLTSNDLQTGSPWGLGRTNARFKASSPYKFTFDPSWGAGVTVYILDTGINTNHIDFGGRATTGMIAVSGENATDCIGHGTHVAGTVGSNTYGIARNASIVGVKVFMCNGTGRVSNTIAGLNWVLSDYTNRTNDSITKKTSKPKAIVNLSVSGPYSSALNAAITNVVSAGIAVVSSAGNVADDACKYSPASAPATICVGAINVTDSVAPFSNYGKCVNLFAPGVSIRSTYIGSNNATALMSGTSMAAPHVSGVLAAIQSKSGPNPYSVQQLRSMLLSNATVGVLNITNASPNVMIYNPLILGIITQPYI
ncbi:hypothetical protein BB560_004027 [Smittium megazygosporum]|uniref:Peptidase S8/S53 domain-containing protein n=1 Tax=Smittium megazygosporum TaxID=133381 RepID=A0A2T9ZAE2_9FUNG|nr:hypothetical protein BB560_004027 [Smittium megazygosporum]